MLCILQPGKKKKKSLFHLSPSSLRSLRERAKLSTLNLLSNSFSLENYGFEEWSWYVICSVYYKSEFSQYFCFVLFVSGELCNQSRCLKQSRKRPLWIRENLVHSIFLYVCTRKGGGAWQQSKYMALFSVYYTRMLHLFFFSWRDSNHHTCIHLKKKEKKKSEHLTLFKWQSGAPDEVHNYSACTILTDATEVQPSLRWISVMAKKKKKKKKETEVWRQCCCWSFHDV